MARKPNRVRRHGPPPARRSFSKRMADNAWLAVAGRFSMIVVGTCAPIVCYWLVTSTLGQDKAQALQQQTVSALAQNVREQGAAVVDLTQSLSKLTEAQAVLTTNQANLTEVTERNRASLAQQIEQQAADIDRLDTRIDNLKYPNTTDGQ